MARAPRASAPPARAGAWPRLGHRFGGPHRLVALERLRLVFAADWAQWALSSRDAGTGSGHGIRERDPETGSRNRLWGQFGKRAAIQDRSILRMAGAQDGAALATPTADRSRPLMRCHTAHFAALEAASWAPGRARVSAVPATYRAAYSVAIAPLERSLKRGLVLYFWGPSMNAGRAECRIHPFQRRVNGCLCPTSRDVTGLRARPLGVRGVRYAMRQRQCDGSMVRQGLQQPQPATRERGNINCQPVQLRWARAR